MLSNKLTAEVIIVGGGLVGYTAALAFAQAGKSVFILEAKKPNMEALLQTEGRAIALAHTSCLLYQTLGLWKQLQEQGEPIRDIIVSQQKSFGKCRISAKDYQLNALGTVVPATHIAECLFNAVQAHENITLHAPYEVDHIAETPGQVCVNNEYAAKLLLACDGAQSFTRHYFNIDTNEKKYEQHAVVANVTVSPAHNGLALQRFTQQGVLALLPLQHNRMTTVLTLPTDALKTLPENNAAYLHHLQSLLGKRHGVLSDLGKRFDYPLTWMQANKVVEGRTVLLGNAAHTISPIAAQGLNIALRDLALLYDAAMQNPQDLGSPESLQQYAEQSQAAQQQVMGFTDTLTEWVKATSLSALRSAGLFALDHLSFIKEPLAKSLMGLSSHRGSLMRGDHDKL